MKRLSNNENTLIKLQNNMDIIHDLEDNRKDMEKILESYLEKLDKINSQYENITSRNMITLAKDISNLLYNLSNHEQTYNKQLNREYDRINKEQ